ncbi:hypothetical protein GCK32_003694 [Trichostrongylus colubriformis]|uniref:Uncharacterized protein n=2 Tax=Trichostrongylus colubriformis TaxID=6319 RepID=A0AAN8IUH4_TRICO
MKTKSSRNAYMLRAACILLQYVTLVPARSVMNFYSAPEHAEISGTRSSPATLSPTLAADASLNVPYPIAADNMGSFGRGGQPNVVSGNLDRIANDPQTRKLPILRIDLDTAKSPDQVTPTDYAPEMPPQHEVLRGVEVPSVNNRDGASQSEVVLDNSMTQVEVIQAGEVAIAVPSVPTNTITSAPAERKEDIAEKATTQKVVEKEMKLDEENDYVMELKEHEVDELPSPKTLFVDHRKPKIISSISLDELSNGSALVSINEETPPLGNGVSGKIEPKSIEDEDSDAFNELDEKSEIELEFHDDADIGTTAAVPEEPSSTTTALAATSSSTLTEEPVTDEEIFDLLMYLVMLLPNAEKTEQSVWSKIIAGLQCALRDCRRAFPHLTTVATPIGNGTFIIRRARSECSCPIS